MQYIQVCQGVAKGLKPLEVHMDLFHFRPNKFILFFKNLLNI